MNRFLILLVVLFGLQPTWGQELLKSWQPMRAMEGPEPIRKMAVSTDGSLVLVLLKDNRIRVYDPVKQETLRYIDALPAEVVALAGSGRKGPVLIATEKALFSVPAVGSEGPRKLWDSRDSIYAITSAPTRDFCAVATADGAFIVNSRTGDVALSTREATCLAAQFAPNEKTLALALGKRVVLYDIPSFVQKQAWSINGFVYSLAYAPNSEFVAIGGEGNSLTLRRVADGQTMKSLSLGVSAREVEHLAFAADQSGLFVATGNRLVVFDNLNLEKPTSRSIKLEEKVHSMGYSKASESLLVGSENERSLSMWGVSQPKPPEPLVAFETVRPPTLTLLSPAPETQVRSNLQELVFKVDSNGKQSATGIRVLVDGHPARVLAAQAPNGAKPLSVNGVLSQTFLSGEEYRFQVEIPTQDATLVILAETPFATSTPKVARLRWDHAASLPAPPVPIQVVPPTVAILAPGAEATLTEPRLELEVRVTAPSNQPITGVKILVDGTPVPTQPKPTSPGVGSLGTPGVGGSPQFLSGQSYRYHLVVPTRDTTVVVIAETAYANSNPAVVKVRWKGEGSLTPLRPSVPIVPPSLNIQEPRPNTLFKEGSHRVALTLASAQEQEASSLKFFVDGAPVTATPEPEAMPDAKGRLPHGRVIHFRVDLPKKDCVLMVLAGNAFGTGNPVVLPLKWEGTEALVRPPVALQPPTIQLLGPGPESLFKGRQVSLKLRLDVSPGQKATGLRVFVDGILMPPMGLPKQGLAGLPTGVPLDLSVAVPERDCTLLVLADNESVTSNPAILRLRFDAPVAPPLPVALQMPERVIPPSVKILEPKPERLFKDPEYLLALQLGSAPAQDIKQLKVYLDGAPLNLTPEATAPGEDPFRNGATVKFRIPLPDRDCTLMVQAESNFRTSDPAVLRLKFDRPLPPPVKVRLAKPIVTILDPAPNALVKATTVQMKVKVVTAGDHPVRLLRVLVDGIPVEALQLRGLRPQQDLAPTPAPAQEGEALLKQELRTVSFTIPSKDCSVMVYADTDQTSSDPDVLSLKWEKKDLQTLPTLYLLAVGVSQYKDPAYSLIFPAKDAKDFVALMEKQNGRHYKDIKVRTLVDAEATRDNIQDGLDWLAAQVTQKDVAVVFLAGHGINHFSTNNYYYMPHDARIESPSRTMVSGNEVHAILSKLQGKRILLMDTCHSGNVSGTTQRAVGDMDRFVREITQGGQGLVVFAASKGAGMAEEDAKWGNGAFTKALLEGLSGKAGKDANGLITWKMLDNHITQRVKELTSGKQQPTTTPTPDTPDFSLAVLEVP